MRLFDILNLDMRKFNKLKTFELQDILQKMRRQSQIRVRHIKNAGYDSILHNLPNFKISFNKLNINQLRNQYIIYKEFLQRKTSTLRGARSLYNRIHKTFKSRKNYLNVISIYKKVVEFQPVYNYIYESKMLQRKIYSIMTKNADLDEEELIEMILKKLDREYEKRGMKGKTPEDIDEEEFDELF